MLFASAATFWIVFASIAGGAFVLWRVGVRRGWWPELKPRPDPKPGPGPKPKPGPGPKPSPTADLTIFAVHESGMRAWRRWLKFHGVAAYCRQSKRLAFVPLDDEAEDEHGNPQYVDVVEMAIGVGLPCLVVLKKDGRVTAIRFPATTAKAIEIIKANGG